MTNIHRNYIVGIDSTDSELGGCTTFTAVRILRDLQNDVSSKISLHLVRLNPNVPTKTRGNAAVKMIFSSKLSLSSLAKRITTIVENEFHLYSNNSTKEPGVAILVGDKSSSQLYHKALHEIIELDEALRMQPADFLWPEKSLGLIGALAAISSNFNDHTFELLTYRLPQNYGTQREINLDQIIAYSKKYKLTFGSYNKNRQLIGPTGPDPVLVGIRGENKKQLSEALDSLDLEPIFDKYIFTTNQGTNEHVINFQDSIKLHHVVAFDCYVSENPKMLKGGHLKLKIRYKSEEIVAMAFEPTKNLVKNTRELIIGDHIFIHGSVAKNDYGKFIGLEYLEIVALVSQVVHAPFCISCNKKMTSAGSLKGYKCKYCKKKSLMPEKSLISRNLFAGQKIYADLSAQRHLTRPIERLHLFAMS